jgi:hypothetical protein
MSNIPAKPDEDEQRTEAQLEDILERVIHLCLQPPLLNKTDA